MPFLDQSDLVASNDLRKFIDLVRSKAIIAGQLKRLEPELGLFIVAFHMNVRRLPRLASVKVETIRSDAQNGRHTRQLALFRQFDSFLQHVSHGAGEEANRPLVSLPFLPGQHYNNH